MSKLGLEGHDLGHQLGDVLFGGHSEALLLLMLRVSRLKLSSTVRACSRLGAYTKSGYLRGSDVSMGGHSRGTGPC